MRSNLKSAYCSARNGIINFFKRNDGAQIAELAVSLPLLTLMFVGTYDFGQAFNIKQKLAGAAREGARFAALQSMSDLTTTSTTCGTTQNGPPTSVCAVRDIVDNYLVSATLNDCGLSSATGSANTGWSWTFTATCPAGDFTLTVNRSFTYTNSNNNNEVIEASQVTLSYPYQWHFNRVIKLVVPANYAGVTNIPGVAVVQNLN